MSFYFLWISGETNGGRKIIQNLIIKKCKLKHQIKKTLKLHNNKINMYIFQIKTSKCKKKKKKIITHKQKMIIFLNSRGLRLKGLSYQFSPTFDLWLFYCYFKGRLSGFSKSFSKKLKIAEQKKKKKLEDKKNP